MKYPKKVTLLIAAIALVAVPAMAQNSHDVNASAALEGNFGFEVIFDGASNNTVYVQDDSPANETTYRANFLWDPNGIGINDASPTGRIAMLFQVMGPNLGNGQTLMKMLIKRRSATKWSVLCFGIDAGGKNRRTYDTLGGKHAIVVDDSPHDITIEGVFLNQQQGYARCTVDGVMHETQSSYQGQPTTATFVRLGATRDIGRILNGPEPIGSYYIDRFSSFRTLAP